MKPFNALFWAVMLILAGAVLLIRHVGGFKFSAWSVIFGLFVVLLGVSLLTGGLGSNKPISEGGNVIFSSGSLKPSAGGECNVVFSSGSVDLRDVKPEDGKIEINVVFSSAEILLPEGPVKVEATAAFGQVSLPGGSSVVFGDRTYERGDGEPVRIEINCVFGSASVR